jgi:hypothetical protein
MMSKNSATQSLTFLLAFNLLSLIARVEAQPVELLANGGFETGNFSGWTAFTTGAPFGPWRVDGAGFGMGFGMLKTEPQEGSKIAWNGFDGFGPMTFVMFQNVTIPADHSATLQWIDRAQWNFTVAFFASKTRVYEVRIEDPLTGEALEVVHHFETGTQDTNPTGNTGWLNHSADLSAYAGQTVRIAFFVDVPENLTGPGQLEIDGVSLLAEEIVEVPEEPTVLWVPLDIKPGGCPNPINIRAKGVTPVAVLGTPELDVTQIDETTLFLAGVAPVRVGWEDVAGPAGEIHEASSCDDCETGGPDGLLDLVLKWDTPELVEGVEAVFGGTPNDRECLILSLEGATLDGTPLYGEDTVLFLNKKPPKGGATQGRKK